MVPDMSGAIRTFFARNPFAVLVGKVHIHSRWSSSEDIS